MPTNSRSGDWRNFFKKHTTCDAHHAVSIQGRRGLEGPTRCPTGHAQLEATTTARNHQFATALNLGRSVSPPPLGPGAVVVKNRSCPTPRPSRGHAASPRSPPRACAQPPRARTARRHAARRRCSRRAVLLAVSALFFRRSGPPRSITLTATAVI